MISGHFSLMLVINAYTLRMGCIVVWVPPAFVEDIIFLVMSAKHTPAMWLYSPVLKILNFGCQRGVCLPVASQWTIRTIGAQVPLCYLLSQSCGE